MPNAQPLTAELFIDGVWTAYPLYAAEEVEVEVGPDDETGTQPNKITMTWNNDTLDMDPNRPQSALYGKIGRNTPVRVRVGGTTLTHAQATLWDPDRTVEHSPSSGRGRSWTSFQATGLLGQLARWDDPILSPMTRKLSTYSTIKGLWPLEGGNSDTTRLSQIAAAPGATAGTISGTVTFAGDEGAGGSDKALELGAGATIGGRFSRHTTSGWQVLFHAKLPAVPGSATYGTMFRLYLTNAVTVEWQVNDTAYRLFVSQPDGTVLLSMPIGRGGVDVTKWVRHRIKVTVSGGTVTYEMAWYMQDAATIWGTSGTYAATSTGALLAWDITQMAYNQGAAYSHIFGITDTAVDLTTDYDSVESFNGYLGERAASRFIRLMFEEGFQPYIGGTGTDSIPMGRQKPGVFLDLLEECMRTEGGLIYDEPTVAGAMLFRTRVNILDQTVKLALTRGVNVAPPLHPVTDDQGVTNHVVVENFDGATATAVLTAGSQSVLPPTSGGIGRYKRQLDVNQENSDELLDARASWELAKGTVDRPRYKTIVIDLVANPSLATSVSNLRPGDLITLAGAEPDTVRLHVLKIVHTVGAATRKATLSCRPADAWALGKYDDTGARYDSGSTTTSGTSTTTATSIGVTTSWKSETWSTTAVPYDVKIAGERMTVTACTAAAGSGPYTQTFTVTRSVNGVVKAHVAGETVSLADPVRYAYW